ncbi:MAG: alanine racemase, partial [Bacteroidetes bacterium]|nr:alanine racemase [Bacteroidota bacterium]
MDWHNLTKNNTPFFLYDFDKIKSNHAFLEKFLNLNRNKLFYSVKSNPNMCLIKKIDSFVDGFDISSFIELQALLKFGINPQRVSFSGPGKTNEAILSALNNNIKSIHIDSIDELNFIIKLKDKFQDTDFSLRIHTKGEEDKLGFNENYLNAAFEILKKEDSFKLKGLHSYLGRERFSKPYFNEVLDLLDNTINRSRDHFKKDIEIFIGP